ncbi:MAG TPA: hypothetical protein VFC63_17135 [Blastocatellia bacterium]|nr:hypothetical protein [Blastocatellia bacterium]
MKRTARLISYCLDGLDSLLTAIIIRRPIYLELATNLAVSSEWIEIIPQKPLTAEKDRNDIILSIEGYLHNIHEPFHPIKMPDGTVVNPEIQIVDQDGIVYPLKFSLRIGSSLGFGGVPSAKWDKSVRNRVYVKVRIRCDEPITLSKVFWACSYMK